MELIHGLLRSNRAQRVDQLAFYKVTKLVGLKCSLS